MPRLKPEVVALDRLEPGFVTAGAAAPARGLSRRRATPSLADAVELLLECAAESD